MKTFLFLTAFVSASSAFGAGKIPDGSRWAGAKGHYLVADNGVVTSFVYEFKKNVVTITKTCHFTESPHSAWFYHKDVSVTSQGRTTISGTTVTIPEMNEVRAEVDRGARYCAYSYLRDDKFEYKLLSGGQVLFLKNVDTQGSMYLKRIP